MWLLPSVSPPAMLSMRFNINVYDDASLPPDWCIKCTITEVAGMLWLTFEIVNTCLTQLESRPPFESSLHSQLWGAAHRGSQKHLQSWNSVWDLCSDYTGTSRVHILSHDFPCQDNSLPLLGRKTVTLGFKIRVSSKTIENEDANDVYVSVSWHFSLLAKITNFLPIITSMLEILKKHCVLMIITSHSHNRTQSSLGLLAMMQKQL